MKRMFAALLVLFVVASPALAQVPAGCNPPPVERPLDTTPPINLSLLKQSLIYYRCTLYDADIAKVVAEARDWVAQRAPQVAKPAIVLDIDETALSNWAEIYHNDFGFIYGGGCDLNAKTACGVHAWELSARGVAIKPTLELYNLARKLKGKNGSRLAIFFITGRDEATDERAATVRNLRKAGYDGWKKLHLRPRGANHGKFVSDYKMAVRALIEGDGYTIIANLGDQMSDLVGEHAERCYKLPNPFYYSPGGPVPESGLGCLRR